jgi:hypothetical protein
MVIGYMVAAANPLPYSSSSSAGIAGMSAGGAFGLRGIDSPGEHNTP